MHASQPFAWPDNCQCAISLTFDDGLRSQLAVAIPRLEERGYRGTFYLTPRGEDWSAPLAPWQPVQAARPPVRVPGPTTTGGIPRRSVSASSKVGKSSGTTHPRTLASTSSAFAPREARSSDNNALSSSGVR